MFEEMMNQIGQYTEAKTYTTGALVKGTLATGKINPSPILNSDHTRKGAKNDSSITFGTANVFVTEVNPNQLSNDGDYFINYLTGEYKVIPGANAAGGVAITYYVNELMVYLLADIEIGAIEVKDGTTDTRAKVGVGTAIAESDNALAVKDAAIGTTTDAVVATDAAGTLSAKLRGVVKLLDVMDDWDENDRAKVNPIAGQIGIAAGTGVDGATVPRVTLATNVGLPAGTNSIGIVSITATAPQTMGTDTTGQDAFETVVTANTEKHHMAVTLEGSYGAIISVDGTNNHFNIPAQSAHCFDDVLIANGATVKAKNASAGYNYANLSITIW